MATLTYTVNAVDHASATFRKIALSTDKLNSDLDELGRKTATARVALAGDKEATLAIDKLDFKMAKLAQKVAEGKIGVEGQARAMLEIRRLELAMDRLDTKRAKIHIDTSALSKLPFLQPSAMGTAVALLPTLIPVAGAVAEAVGAIGISFGAAAIGAGGFGLIAGSVLKSASSDAKKLEALNLKLNSATTKSAKDAVRQQIAALKQGWTPAYKQVMNNMDSLQQRFKALAIQIAAPTVATWLKVVLDGLKFIKPALIPVAAVFNDWGKSIDRYFRSGAGSAEVTRLATAFGKFAALQLTQIGMFIKDFGQGVFNLGRDLAGSKANFYTFGTDLTAWGHAFEKWSASKQARDDVNAFVKWMKDNGGTVVQLLKEVGKALPGIFAGATAVGTLELQVVTSFLRFINRLPPGVAKPLTEVAGALLLLSKTGVVKVGLEMTGWAMAGSAAGGAAEAGGAAGAVAALKRSTGLKWIVRGGAAVAITEMLIIPVLSGIPQDKKAGTTFADRPAGTGPKGTSGFESWRQLGRNIIHLFTVQIPAGIRLGGEEIRLGFDNIKLDALSTVFSITGAFGKLPGFMGAPFRAAHAAIGKQMRGVQADITATKVRISADWAALTGHIVGGTGRSVGAIQNQLMPTLARLHASSPRVKHDMDDLAGSILSTGTKSRQSQADRQKMIADLERSGVKASTARRLVNDYIKRVQAIPHNARTDITAFGHGRGRITFSDQIAGQRADGHLEFHAAGGLIRGGIPGRDSVISALTPGEVVVPTAMVRAGAVNHLRGRLPGFAAGGLVTPGTPITHAMPYESNREAIFERQAINVGFKLARKVLRQMMSGGGAIVGDAMRWLHRIPYVWGGTAVPGGADCSGFVQTIYGRHGIGAPRTSEQQGAWVRRSGPVPGGLAFYHSPAGGGDPGHVAIVRNAGQVISQGGGLGPVLMPLHGMPLLWTGIPPHGFPGGAGGAGGSFRESQLAGLWRNAGGPRGVSHLMAAIAMAESGGHANAHNRSGATGLWQIMPSSQQVPGNLFNPLINAENAVRIWDLQGLRAWSAYTNGSYRRFYDRGGWLPPGASIAVNNTGQPERVLPPGGRREGPLVNIENFNPVERADVDLLAHRLAFLDS